MHNRKVNQENEEYAHELGIHHSVQESDAKIDLAKFLLGQKGKKNEKEEKPKE
ncbi:hypothetical protein [Alkalihalobacillus deserti]|uniref:hypothetical protein n=1 Tax=Alkalihalobacillus deserti TaxID=2879466 RepID=UPI001D141F4F|nr:hypothetical protein [Alkalihalobacillus deserti]